MPKREKPNYVEHGGKQVFRQPIVCEDVRFYGFVFAADLDRLRATCDKYLNEPARGAIEFYPVWPRVMLGFADMRRVRPQDLPDAALGWISEIDVAFWVPVAIVRRHGNLRFVERVAWFMPYVFVDNAWAVASGREIYGFPKALGTMTLPTNPDAADRFAVDSLAVARYGTPESIADRPSRARSESSSEISDLCPIQAATLRRVLEVRRLADLGERPPPAAWTNRNEAGDNLAQLMFGGGSITLPGLGLVVELYEFLTQREVPLVFLKQFRDAATPAKACYQAIVEAPATLTNFRRGGRLPGTFRLRIEPLESHPIAQELGLEQGDESTPVAAWYTEFDFIMQCGRELT